MKARSLIELSMDSADENGDIPATLEISFTFEQGVKIPRELLETGREDELDEWVKTEVAKLSDASIRTEAGWSGTSLSTEADGEIWSVS